MDDIISFFKDGSFDLKTLLEKITLDIVDAVMETMENICDVRFQTIPLGIAIVRDLGNDEIDVSVISWLWGLITGGRSFNFVNCCALLVAVPFNVIYKSPQSTAPPKLKGRLTKDTLQQCLEQAKVSSDPNLPSDLFSFGTGAVPSIATLSGIATSMGTLQSALPAASILDLPQGVIRRHPSMSGVPGLTSQIGPAM